MITAALGAFIIGTFFGLATGRFFCKWHHKADNDAIGPSE